MTEVIPSAIKNTILSRRTIIFVYTHTASFGIACSSFNQNKREIKKKKVEALTILFTRMKLLE
jgi:hypothetical protein